jgi:hypothetical protein
MMKVETVEPTEDQVIELAKSQEMKSLMDGSESPLISDPSPKEPVPEVKDQEPAAQDDEADKEPEKVEPTAQEQLQAALDRIQKLERALDKTNGTYGNELSHLKRKISEVESQRREAVKSITPTQLKRISEQYPELAEALANDLTDAFFATVETKQQETIKQEPQDDPRLNDIKDTTNKLAGQVKQIALNELSRVHNDWQSVAAWDTKTIPGVGDVIEWSNPAFGEWVSKQDDDVREVVFGSDDISAISQVITKFKESIKHKEDTQETKETQQAKPSINKKLEKAVLPTGKRTGAHELLSDDEVIAQAMREEQKRIMNGY